ncbi:MAG: hypothetical protein C0490_10835 [Marivirga sp.]|nr:hypothetical protein [Marivirga sp.]
MRVVKPLLIFGLVLIQSAPCLSQKKEGKITYSIKSNIPRSLPKDREMKNMISEFYPSNIELIFNATKSLSTPVASDEDGPTVEKSRAPLLQSPKVYLNLETFEAVSMVEFMGEDYLIPDKLTMKAWKFEADTKTIMKYDCKKATLIDTLNFNGRPLIQTIVAWYAPDLRPFLGPETYHSLPGAVLEINLNEGEKVIRAIDIKMQTLKKNRLKIPTKGKRVTQLEFQTIVAEGMKKIG